MRKDFLYGYEPPYDPLGKRQFECYYYFVGWSSVSLGVSVCVSLPNIEIHLPFGFIRIGWRKDPKAEDVEYWTEQ